MRAKTQSQISITDLRQKFESYMEDSYSLERTEAWRRVLHGEMDVAFSAKDAELYQELEKMYVSILNKTPLWD